ncbi:MAG: hypothetical protein K2O69_01525 [Odoribacter sp.]|nr:hypothetical protein [Odoribacter sp.]
MVGCCFAEKLFLRIQSRTMEPLITLEVDGVKKDFFQDAINYVKSCGNCSEIVFFDGMKLFVADCFSKLEQQLDLKMFAKISEDCFVNMSHSFVAIESEFLDEKEQMNAESEYQPQHFICLN